MTVLRRARSESDRSDHGLRENVVERRVAEMLPLPSVRVSLLRIA
jgi:hypothetical protein